jgi:predicted secreted protein
MFGNRIGRLCFVVLLFVIAACNANGGSARKGQKMSGNDTIKVNGCQESSIRAKVGSILELKLEAVPGSGFQWLQKEPSQMLQLLDPDSLKFTRPESSEPTPGSSGHQVLHFKVIKEGTGTLRLEYKRTWESELMNQCELKIEVTP